MAKTFHTLRDTVTEWMSVPTSHISPVTDRMSVRTNASRKAKRPSVIQLDKVPYTKAERAKKRIHGFTIEDPKSL